MSPADFGIHNMLFRPDGSICFIDFEYFGWDDPMRLVSSFFYHDANSQIPTDKRQYFIEGYKQNSPLPPSTLKRVDASMLLSSAEWIGMMLWSITPEKINSRAFSDPNFDRNKYVGGQIKKITKRLVDLGEDLYK